MADGKLTALGVKGLKTPGTYSDGGGLNLVIAGKSKSWVFRYKKNKQEHGMGLGSARLVPLTTARDAGIDAGRLLLAGIDPIERKRAIERERAAATASAKTFETVGVGCGSTNGRRLYQHPCDGYHTT